MLRDYKDIIDKLGPPQWWDDNGCPRYCAFSPDVCGIYDVYIALLKIACQRCGKGFLVAAGRSRQTSEQREGLFPTSEFVGWGFHYGDPPPHGCIGDTMNVETLQVLEFWDRSKLMEGWKRRPELEFTYPTPEPLAER